MGWYVLYCKAGREERLRKACQRHLSERAAEEIFLFSCERLRKYSGKWHRDQGLLFPGYVFIQSSRPMLLSQELDEFRDIAGVLEQEQLLLPVCPGEEEALLELCGAGHHMGLTKVLVQDQEIRVMEGPLSGKEAMIQKWDLHKRIAVLDFKVTANGRNLWAGIDIMRAPKA